MKLNIGKTREIENRHELPREQEQSRTIQLENRNILELKNCRKRRDLNSRTIELEKKNRLEL